MPDELPDYVRHFQRKKPGISRFAIERSILRQWQREWSKDNSSPYGTSYTDHFLAYAKIFLPKTDQHGFFKRAATSFEETVLKRDRKIINWIGSQNSGKTDNKASFAHLFLSIWPEYTTVYMAAPTEKAARSTCWGRTLTRFRQIKDAHPTFAKNWFHRASEDKVVYYKGTETGFIECRTIPRIANLQGTKSFDPEKGWLMLFADEIAEFQNTCLLDIVANLTGNDNFVCFTGCNFKDTEGLEGVLCHPEDGEGYQSLDIEKDQEWESNYNSMTWRFDGHRSPNILAGKTIHKYLLTEEKRATAEKIHGPRGPKYLEQIRSFPNMSLADSYVVTRDDIRSGGGEDEFVFAAPGSGGRVVALDPGWEGDPCKIGVYEWVRARVINADGRSQDQWVFQPVGEHEAITMDTELVASTEWIARVRSFGQNPTVVRGRKVSMDQQIAVKAGEFCRRHKVPLSNFIYDGSMRPKLAQEMISVLGNEPTIFHPNERATDRTCDAEGNKAHEVYYNYNSECIFAFATLVVSGQFRGARIIVAAVSQICRRKWEYSGKKKKCENKKDYKKNNQNLSPNDADTLVMALEMARRRGFELIQERSEVIPDSTHGLLDKLSDEGRFKPRQARKLNNSVLA